MTQQKVADLIQDYTITLNGINANIYETPDGILIDNNDFTSLELRYDELHLSYPKFKEELVTNNGKFKV